MIRVGVIGVGNLGRHHATKYKKIPSCELVGIYDPDQDRMQQVADELGVEAFSSFRELLDNVDAVSIATPTSTHYRMGSECIEAQKHCLIEKPITDDWHKAVKLVELAKQKNVLIQVGFIERFNPAFRAFQSEIYNPQFIECDRMAPFHERPIDSDVVIDLMIHDIDLVFQLIPTKLKTVNAVGRIIQTGMIDYAHVQLFFENGSIAQLHANRLATKKQRTMKIYSGDVYYLLDFVKPSASKRRINQETVLEEAKVEKHDALTKELQSFIESVQNGVEPQASGHGSLKTIQLVESIVADIHANTKLWSSSG